MSIHDLAPGASPTGWRNRIVTDCDEALVRQLGDGIVLALSQPRAGSWLAELEFYSATAPAELAAYSRVGRWDAIDPPLTEARTAALAWCAARSIRTYRAVAE